MAPAPAPTHLDLDNDSGGSVMMDDDDDDYIPPTADAYPRATVEAVQAALTIWVREFKSALSFPDDYSEHHDHLTDGFQVLSRLANKLGASEGTIIKHITPVMKDMYYRGWKQSMHQEPLANAYRAHRRGDEPEDWTPPTSAPPRGIRR